MISPYILCSVESSTIASRELIRLMKVPVETYSDILQILKLENYQRAMDLLDFQGRKLVALHVVQSVVDMGVLVPSADEVREMEGR